MFYIKFVELRVRHCPLCKDNILHECGSLFHQEDETRPMIMLFSVYECLKCGYTYDPNGKIFSKEFKKM